MNVWYWDRDMTKIRGGEWLRAKILETSTTSAMVKIELTEDQKGSRQFWGNRSKLKPNPDPWHDVVIPGFDGRDAVPEVPPDDKEEPIPEHQTVHLALDLDTDDEFIVPGGMQHEEFDYSPTDAEDEAGGAPEK